ncbi:MAG TPA: putative sugar nucleotidyl transferase [Flavipsychrobacter sp.]
MNIILFDDSSRYSLLPFTHTRPIADIRCGIMTMRERWEHFIGTETSTMTAPYLQQVFPMHSGSDNLFINGSIFATADLYAIIQKLEPMQQLVQDDLIIATRVSDSELQFVPELKSL